MRTAIAILVLAGLVATGVTQGTAHGGTSIAGELRVLYVLATWGPTPFTTGDAERVAAETAEFFHESSAGRLSVESGVVGPLRLPRAVFDSCDATVLRNASPPATFAGYDRIAFVAPLVAGCNFAGEANPTEVLLNGRLSRTLAVHELAHTLGLGHASRWDCVGGRCTIDEYGSEYSVMGGGSGDLNAYEKSTLEWLTGVLRPDGRALYEIGSIDGPTTLPQALVVTTAADELWFESRGRATPSFGSEGSEQPAGVAVMAGPAPEGEPSPYPRANLLLPNPRGAGRHGYVAGEAFVQPGVLRLVVERHAPAGAALRLEWLDRTAPTGPRLTVRARGRGRVHLTWDPSVERGSGVDTYRVLVDGRVVRTLRQQFPFSGWRATLRVERGWHRIGVVATDRAGNRGRVARARVRVT
jgi:Gametolysin peptidase M11